MRFIRKLIGKKPSQAQYEPISKYSTDTYRGIISHLLIIYNTPGPQNLELETRKIIKFITFSGSGPSPKCKVRIIMEPISEVTNYQRLRELMQQWLDKEGGYQSFSIWGEEGINAHVERYGSAQAIWAVSKDEASAFDKRLSKIHDDILKRELAKIKKERTEKDSSHLDEPLSESESDTPDLSSSPSQETETQNTMHSSLADAMFRKRTHTTSASEAVNALFNEYLPIVPKLTTQEVREEYDIISSRWDSKRLVEGTEEEVRNVILINLREMAKRSDFKEYDAEAIQIQKCAQVNVTFKTEPRETFIAIRVWRSRDKVFAAGDENFG